SRDERAKGREAHVHGGVKPHYTRKNEQAMCHGSTVKTGAFLSICARALTKRGQFCPVTSDDMEGASGDGCYNRCREVEPPRLCRGGPAFRFCAAHERAAPV